ncbi:MAG: hypothetical protein WBC33_12670 [Conexibacter sp.]
MHRSCRLAFAAVAAALVLGVASGAALATRAITLEPAEENAASGTITITSPEIAFIRVACPLTLVFESIAERIVKRVEDPVGIVSAVRFARGCTGGVARILEVARGSEVLATPWRITYLAFAGTLPEITSVRVEVRALNLLIDTERNFYRCLIRGGTMTQVAATLEGNPATTFVFDATTAASLELGLGGLFMCPWRFNVSGTLTFERGITLGLQA